MRPIGEMTVVKNLSVQRRPDPQSTDLQLRDETKGPLQRTPETPPAELQLCEDFKGACSNLLKGIHRDGVTIDALDQAEGYRRNLPKLQRIIERQFGYASNSDIAFEVSKLAGSYPSASKQDLTAFVSILCDDIAEDRPLLHKLRAAMKHLRQSSRFLPSVAEVLTALKSTKSPWTDYRFYIDNFDRHLAEAKRKLQSTRQLTEAARSTRSLPSPERWGGDDQIPSPSA